MHHLKRLYNLLIVLTFWTVSLSQNIRPCQFSVYKNSNGLANQVVKSITADENGFVWVLSDNQVQWFDGNNFHSIPFGKGIHQIPGVQFQDIYRTSDGQLWIFYDNSFSVYNPKTHSFFHNEDSIPAAGESLLVPLADIKKEFIAIINTTLVYIDKTSHKVNRLRKTQKGVVNFYFNQNLNNKWIFFPHGDHFTAENTERGETFHIPFIKQGTTFPGLFINDTLLLSFSFSSAFIHNVKSGDCIKRVDYPEKKTLPSFSKPQDICWTQNKTLLFLLENELWEFDPASLSFSKKFTPLNGNTFFGTGYFKTVFSDKNGVLWAGTNLEGLYRINLGTQPFQQFATGKENESFTKCILVNKPFNRVLCGTYGSGLLIYDTSSRLIKHIPFSLPGNRDPVIVTSLKQINPDEVLIFLYGRKDQYILNLKTQKVFALKTKHILKPDFELMPGYYSEPVLLGENRLYFTGFEEYFLLNYKNGILTVSNCDPETRRKIVFPEIFPVKLIKLAEYTGSDFFNTCFERIGLPRNAVNCIARKANHWLIGTVKGIFEFDEQGNPVAVHNMANGLPDEYIYAAITDNEGNIWCSHNKGLSKIDRNRTVINFTKADGLQDNEFNFMAVAKTPDGQLFFGGINGINSFYPSQLSNRFDSPQLVISKIITNNGELPADTAFWNIKTLELEYNNRIQIQFAALGNAVSETYNFQYRIKGLDKEWKNLRHTQELNFALPPGHYQLELATSGLFSNKIAAQKLIDVIIYPPFYLSWWFILLAITAAIVGSAYLFRFINQRKYRSKLQALKMQEELENERQRISRDLHDNIGAYTSALLANVDKLRQKNGEDAEIHKMQNNAEQILNSLRETIWVLNNKEVSVSDFSDGFKTYCFKLLRNFEHIGFNAEEQILNNVQLKAGVSIHLNKIMQEVVQNIIKHSKATQINYSVVCDKECNIILADNGTGFDVEEKRSGNGLDNMYWRAKEAGVYLSITSSEKAGTLVEIKLQML